MLQAWRRRHRRRRPAIGGCPPLSRWPACSRSSGTSPWRPTSRAPTTDAGEGVSCRCLRPGQCRACPIFPCTRRRPDRRADFEQRGAAPRGLADHVVDFLVTFHLGRENLFRDYFDLKRDLDQIVGREVGLVTERSVRTFFKAWQPSATHRTSMQPRAGAHLWDAAEAARLVQRFARDTTEAEFTSSLVIRSAVRRQLEVPGRP